MKLLRVQLSTNNSVLHFFTCNFVIGGGLITAKYGVSKLDCGPSHVNSPDCILAVPLCLDDLLPHGEFSVLFSFGLVARSPLHLYSVPALGRHSLAIQRRDTWSHTSIFHFLTRILQLSVLPTYGFGKTL